MAIIQTISLSDTIKPLVSASYKTQNFLGELEESGYKGSFVLHIFDLKEKLFDTFCSGVSRFIQKY